MEDRYTGVMHIFSENKLLSQVLAFFVSLSVFFLASLPFHMLQAATLTSVSNTMSSQKVSASSTHSIKFTTPTGAAENTDTIVITFPTGFSFVGKATSSISFTHGPSTGLETTEVIGPTGSTTAWSATFTGTASTTLTLTAPSDGVGTAALAANDRVIIGLTNASSTNPATPGSYSIAISGTFGDNGTTTVSIVNDDQVAIDATVAQSITFSISDNSVSFGVITSGASRYASGTAAGDASEVEAHNLVVGTNASNGYTMTASGTTLTSGSNTITPIGASNTAASTSIEQFGLRLVASGGLGAVAAPYASSSSGFAFDTASFPDVVATSTSATANTTYSARYIANIAANTEAGSYTSTITYVASANY